MSRQIAFDVQKDFIQYFIVLPKIGVRLANRLNIFRYDIDEAPQYRESSHYRLNETFRAHNYETKLEGNLKFVDAF